jgi:hypothetical protein
MSNKKEGSNERGGFYFWWLAFFVCAKFDEIPETHPQNTD